MTTPALGEMTNEQLFEDAGEEIVHPYERRCLTEIRRRFAALEAKVADLENSLYGYINQDYRNSGEG